MLSRIDDRACRLGACALVAFIAGCGNQEAAPPPPAGPAQVAVTTIQPQAVPVTRELEGRTTAYLVAEVRPQVGGIIEKREFREGGDVQAGDLLYRIASAMYEAEEARAQAALGRAQASLRAATSMADRFRELLKASATSR